MVEKSGFYYPNKFALITIKAMEEIMGRNGLNAILNLGGLSELVDNYPPDNLEKEFDFADFTALNMALEEMYGPRGGRGLALRAGRATFADALRGFGALADDVGKLPLGLQLFLHLPVLKHQFPGGQGPLDQEGEAVEVYRLRKKIKSPVPHRLDRSLYGAMAGKDDNGDRRPGVDDSPKEVLSREPWHPKVGDNKIDLLLVDNLQGFLPVLRQEGVVSVHLERFAEALSNVLFVVYYEHVKLHVPHHSSSTDAAPSAESGTVWRMPSPPRDARRRRFRPCAL